jgi:two-component sensor histidine kinase
VEIFEAFEATKAAPRSARDAVQVFGERLPATTFRDLQVVVTELVTNAVRYGPSEAVEVWVSVAEDGVVRGEVADGGIGGARIDRDRSLEAGGLGLQIVDALCVAWCNPTGTGRVWFVLEPPGIF